MAFLIPALDRSRLSLDNALWPKHNSAWFMRNKDHFGPYSNMYHDTPMLVTPTLTVQTVEHAYQALRFSNQPDIQAEVLDAKNGWLAKQVARKHQVDSDMNWVKFNLEVMYWLMCIKAFRYNKKFLGLLQEYRGKFLVEHSEKDRFWGARENGDFLQGVNMCGQLWMEVNNGFFLAYTSKHTVEVVTIPAPTWPTLRILGQPLSDVTIPIVWE